MCLLVFPLVEGHELAWPAWILGLLAASIPVLAVFAWYQVRRKRTGATPLVEPSIFTHGAFTSGVLFSLMFVGSIGGIVLIFSVFLQAGLGFSPWHSALTTAPWAAAAFVGSPIGGIAMSHFGRRVAGLGAVFFGLLGAGTGHALDFVNAAQWTALLTAGLLACAFVIAFRLPRRARELSAPATRSESPRGSDWGADWGAGAVSGVGADALSEPVRA
jgi:MFS family permease